MAYNRKVCQCDKCGIKSCNRPRHLWAWRVAYFGFRFSLGLGLVLGIGLGVGLGLGFGLDPVPDFIPNVCVCVCVCMCVICLFSSDVEILSKATNTKYPSKDCTTCLNMIL